MEIWQRCDGPSRIRPLSLEAWRAVEAQHLVSTRKLVDTAEEQSLLEDLLEAAKPAGPTGGRWHYLLFTPFRYPPLRQGSRFGTRRERGLWYGSESVRTVFAEVAYYRLVFLEGMRADPGLVETPLTLFVVKVKASCGVDLRAAPFDRYRGRIASKTSWSDAQPLGGAMRAAGVQAFRWESARDAAGGTNVGVLDPSAFGRSRPARLETWHCSASRDRVEMLKRDYFAREALAFARAEFLVDGRLPFPPG